jgi:RecB family endonuclease NucS
MMGGRCVNLGDRLATHRARGSLRLHNPPLCRPTQHSPPPEQEVAAEVTWLTGSLDLKATKTEEHLQIPLETSPLKLVDVAKSGKDSRRHIDGAGTPLGHQERQSKNGHQADPKAHSDDPT